MNSIIIDFSLAICYNLCAVLCARVWAVVVGIRDKCLKDDISRPRRSPEESKSGCHLAAPET